MTIQPFPSELLAVKQLGDIQRQVSNMVGMAGDNYLTVGISRDNPYSKLTPYEVVHFSTKPDGSSHMMFKYERVDVLDVGTVYLIGFKP